MKTKHLVITFVAIFVLATNLNAQSGKSNSKKTVVFDVSMHCESCQKKIEKNIAYEKGVKDMAVKLEDKTVTIKFDTLKTNESKLISAFNKLGYEAKVVETVPAKSTAK
ncbi:MAG TPA: heavy-metal-associated domain-containing protein [Paludibacteraceae bacterium]|nr:heavy-metal-associated domain-containing protein [Paludibacteraceae bacterium]HPT42502.1 heavy-metal-associated domain-containing protein [Paludibacteraceae bacterium]